ncbi:hypothetical protein K470DRAFT_278671 [Piedraia hortae CBS 480.64]|uniref:Uncharacterized protein n=1 Tax=Piedraia hortae CBS 480.64 TaxID=1314780 RepID=A0A6A7BTI7_9PEZI|nr:hypothetical protein K470DRAFT_278671 [Piedraia hortae CBS 480.64]
MTPKLYVVEISSDDSYDMDDPIDKGNNDKELRKEQSGSSTEEGDLSDKKYLIEEDPLTPSQRVTSSGNVQPLTKTRRSPSTSSLSAGQQDSPLSPAAIRNKAKEPLADTNEASGSGSDSDSNSGDPSLGHYFDEILIRMMRKSHLSSEQDLRFLRSMFPWDPTPRYMPPALDTMKELYESKGEPYKPENLEKLHETSRNYLALRKCLVLILSQYGNLLMGSTFLEKLLTIADEARKREEAAS